MCLQCDTFDATPGINKWQCLQGRNMKLLRTLVVVTMTVLPQVGCADQLTSPVVPPQGMRAGVLEYHGDSAHVTMPSVVTSGSAAVIRVLTWGDGCLRKGRTDVAVISRRETIRPYDLIPDPGTVCNLILLAVEHEAEVLLSENGTWEIDIHGISAPGDERIVVRRNIYVRD